MMRKLVQFEIISQEYTVYFFPVDSMVLYTVGRKFFNFTRTCSQIIHIIINI
jgi:hypothetical protein